MEPQAPSNQNMDQPNAPAPPPQSPVTSPSPVVAPSPRPAAPAVPPMLAGPQVSTMGTDSAAPKKSHKKLIVIGVVVVVLTGLFLLSAPKISLNADGPLISTSDKYMQDLVKHDFGAAVSLESQDIKVEATQDALASTWQQINVPSDASYTMVNENIDAGSSATKGAVVYKMNGIDKLFLRIDLQKNNGQWEVIGFQAQPTDDAGV